MFFFLRLKIDVIEQIEQIDEIDVIDEIEQIDVIDEIGFSIYLLYFLYLLYFFYLIYLLYLFRLLQIDNNLLYIQCAYGVIPYCEVLVVAFAEVVGHGESVEGGACFRLCGSLYSIGYRMSFRTGIHTEYGWSLIFC